MWCTLGPGAVWQLSLRGVHVSGLAEGGVLACCCLLPQGAAKDLLFFLTDHSHVVVLDYDAAGECGPSAVDNPGTRLQGLHCSACYVRPAHTSCSTDSHLSGSRSKAAGSAYFPWCACAQVQCATSG
jgi:hypothetical protein